MLMDQFSPRAFLKQRRPAEFSDSIEQVVSELDRSLLEYHLTTLTSRSQEAAFEEFARLLCGREICPNLLPTTGPTGGGDSKADAETYPVSQRLSLAWLNGFEEGAAQDRWAFAFSAKAQWAPKLESDIAKIAGTGRGYVRAFFVTNQVVKASRRAQLEDRLTKAHGIDVRVLDRTWILDRVFTNRHQALAVKILNITHAHSRVTSEIGPQDQTRRTALAALEERLSETLAAKRTSAAMVDDALEAARLMRELEEPPMHVEASYLRAERLAAQYGSQRQKVEVAYQLAFTRYYWLEDFAGFEEAYETVEKRVKGSRNVFDLERLHTLWVCLWTAVRQGTLDAATALLPQRSRVLREELERLKGEHDRPSTSLQATTLSLETELLQRLAEGQSVDDQLRALSEVIRRGRGLVGFPLQVLFRTLTEVGENFEGTESYNELFEQMVDTSAERDGELAAARLLLKRGRAQCDRRRPVEAIATLGRALTRLYKEESRHELAEALYLCGSACAEVGLPWAARGLLLASASRSADLFWTYGEVTSGLYLAVTGLKWIELSLGRLPQLLNWHENALYLDQVLIDKGTDEETVRAGDIHFEHLLSGLLLRTAPVDLSVLESLPDVLDRLGLDLATDSLLFTLGHEQRLDELALSLGRTAPEVASTWANDRGVSLAAERPSDITPSKCIYRSNVMGCALTLICETSPRCVAVAEGLLGTIEATLATAGLHRILVHAATFTIDIRTQADVPFPFRAVRSEQPDGSALEMSCAEFDPHRLSPQQHQELQTNLSAASIEVIASVVAADEEQLREIFQGERAMERAVHFAGSLSSQPNILGFEPKTQLRAWLTPDLTRFAALRARPWLPDPIPEVLREQPAPPKPESVEEELRRRFDPVKMDHGQMQVHSLIRVGLWDKAGWEGMGFEVTTGPHPRVRLALLFGDSDAGRSIFRGWQEILGRVDEDERLRVTIVRGVDQHQPLAYRVVVGANLPPKDDKKLLILASRIHEMEPQSSQNIELLLDYQAHHEGVCLALGTMTTRADGLVVPEFDDDQWILIRQVVVREAWEIGPHDLDAVAIKPGDLPIIPEGVPDPPVLAVLANLAKRGDRATTRQEARPAQR